MTIPALDTLEVLVPTNLLSQIERAAADPDYEIDFSGKKADAFNNELVDIYALGVPYTKLSPNDVYADQEDFNFFNNKLWSAKKLESEHKTSRKLSDKTLGNRTFGFPLLIKNTFEGTSTRRVKLNITHCIGFQLSYVSSVGSTSSGTHKYEIIAKTPGATKFLDEAATAPAYDLDDADGTSSTFRTFVTTSNNEDVILVSNEAITTGLTTYGAWTSMSYPYSRPKTYLGTVQTMYFEDVGGTLTHYVEIKFRAHPTTGVITVPTSPANESDIVEMYPDNQLIRIIPLGTMLYNEDSIEVSGHNFPNQPKQHGVKSWNYAYTTGKEESVWQNLTIDIPQKRIAKFNISVTRKIDPSSFACGFMIGASVVSI